MFVEQIEINRMKSFKHLVKRNNGNIDTVLHNENGYYSYRTKEGILNTYVAFDSFEKYRKSDFYTEHAERVNGFFFVSLV
jgi:hypothetical protein